MIELLPGYKIDVDDLNYILKKTITRVDKKTKQQKQVEANKGYFPTLPALLRAVLTDINRTEISDGQIQTIEDCIVRFEQTAKNLEEITKNINIRVLENDAERSDSEVE
jgi:hypothetical protein